MQVVDCRLVCSIAQVKTSLPNFPSPIFEWYNGSGTIGWDRDWTESRGKVKVFVKCESMDWSDQYLRAAYDRGCGIASPRIFVGQRK